MNRIDNITFDWQGAEYYYLHRHMEHFEKDEAIALFNQQKQLGYVEARNRYIKNYLSNVSGINNKALEKLNDAMSEEEIVKNLDKAFLDVLNKRVSESIQDYNLEEYLSKGYESLEKYLNTRDAKDLDLLFSQITEAAKLLNTDRGIITALIGRKSEFRKTRDLNKLYEAIKSSIATMEGKTLNVSQKRMLSVLNSLKKFVGATSASSEIGKNKLRGYITNIFSTQIGEYIVSKGAAEGLGYLTKDIRASLTGNKRVKYEEGTELARFINNYGQKKNQTFKTDNSFKDISITLEDGSTFNINLGLSTKWYKNLNANVNSGVAITSETGKEAFVHRLDQMLSGDVEKYYAYNSLELVNEDDSAYRALKAAILARNVDLFISGLGVQGDFAQFIVINGEFYSIWEIINAIAIQNSGQGSSSFGEGATDPITLSATGLASIAALTDSVKNNSPNIYHAYTRAKQQNRMINNLGLTGHFYPQRLKNLTH